MADVETIPLLLTAGPVGSGLLSFRFPPQYAAEIRAQLDDNGLEARRMRAENLSLDKIASVLSVAKSTVAGALSRAEESAASKK